MAELKTTYMGLELSNPIIAGASKLTSYVDSIKKIEDAGAGAIVCGSLFEEQIQLEQQKFDNLLQDISDVDSEISNLFPINVEHKGPEEHLYWLRKTKESVKIPVIASLNCVNQSTWVEYAKMIEETGVDGLELNFFHVPSDMEISSAEVEKQQHEILVDLKSKIKIPISVKLSYFYSNTLNHIKNLDNDGVDAFVLFNKLFQPDINIDEEKHITPFNLSNQGDYGTALRYAGLLHEEIKGNIIANTGIHTGADAIKMLLAGADAVQVVSTLYKNDISQIGVMVKDIQKWMDEKGYKNISDFKGKLSRSNVEDPFIYCRAQYVSLILKSEELVKRYER